MRNIVVIILMLGLFGCGENEKPALDSAVMSESVTDINSTNSEIGNLDKGSWEVLYKTKNHMKLPTSSSKIHIFDGYVSLLPVSVRIRFIEEGSYVIQNMDYKGEGREGYFCIHSPVKNSVMINGFEIKPKQNQAFSKKNSMCGVMKHELDNTVYSPMLYINDGKLSQDDMLKNPDM